MKRIVEETLQNVNSNAGIFLAKQILDAIPSFAKFDSCQPSLKSVVCQTYSNSGIAKAEVELMTLGKTSFCDIAAHQKDDLFTDAVGGAVPTEPMFRQRLGHLAILPEARQWVDDANVELLSKVKDFGLVKTAGEERLPVDIDVSVMVNDDSRKDGVRFTYHRIDGFAPIFATADASTCASAGTAVRRRPSRLYSDGWRPERRQRPSPRQAIPVRVTARNGGTCPKTPSNRPQTLF